MLESRIRLGVKTWLFNRIKNHRQSVACTVRTTFCLHLHWQLSQRLVKLTYVTTSAQMATTVVVKLLRLRTTNFLLGKDQAARTVAAFFLKKQFS
jgi:hypothetical protein